MPVKRKSSHLPDQSPSALPSSDISQAAGPAGSAALRLIHLRKDHQVHLESLNEESHAEELIYAFGRVMGDVATKFALVHQYVTWLRSKDFRLDSDALMNEARALISQAYVDATEDAVDSYARGLRSLLSCTDLPEKFSVTNGVSVPSYSFGDLVDGQFIVGDSDTRAWFAGVVVGIRHKCQKRPYECFWLNQVPKSKDPNQNPKWMSVHSLRPHCAGAMFGSSEDWDAQKVRTEYAPDKRAADLHVKELPGLNHDPVMPKPAVPQSSAMETQQPSGGRPKRGCNSIRSRSPETDEGQGQRQRKKKNKPSVPVPPPAKQQSTLGSQESFEVADSVKFAIDCLESLDRGDPEHPETWSGLVKRIKSIAASLASIYCNKSYNTMVSDTLAELEGYAGPEAPRLPHSKFFLSLLAKHGFCITPRMYSKCEILCIGIAMLDTKHHYVRIQQKAGNKKGEAGFRGMALLDPRVNRVMYNRLKRYGFANPRFHPTALHPFSSVVINGGGSWLQSSDWDFTLQSRFRVNPDATPFAFVVSNTPGVLEANGLYVATTLQRNSHTVYVQVSAIEFSGPPTTVKKKVKDFAPFRQCLQDEAVAKLEPFALDSQGHRLEACSPRVMFCCGGTQWGIQLLPSFDTAMYLVQFTWSPGGSDATNAKCFKKPIYSTGKSLNSTQECSITITKKFDAAAVCKQLDARPHFFSFGTQKCALRNANEECAVVPAPLMAQGIHGDGPEFYNSSVYTALGELKTTALSCAEEKRRQNLFTANQESRVIGAIGSCVVSDADHLNANPWCPFKPNLLLPFLGEQNTILEESWSALGSVFSKTYIETPVYLETTPVPKRHPVLRVAIPLGCMAPFTYFWKHRGKGDIVEDKAQLPPIHLRPHDYMYNGDPRKHPTFDTEATFEFTGLCSNTAAHTDPASGLQVLECLQTFTPESALGHQETLPVYHEYFRTQQDLDEYVARALALQCEEKIILHVPVQDLYSWKIGLPALILQSHAIRVVGVTDKQTKQRSFDAIFADFDSDVPVFHCKDGKRIKLCGPPHPELNSIAHVHSAIVKDSVFLELVESAYAAVHTNWCSASLHELLCLLNTQVLKDAKLSINADNILEARSGDTTKPSATSYCHSLLPSYIKLELNNMRLYTSRGDGTRFVIPEP